jgi:N-acetylglucosaminyl-diphospho-decaprenol L-rhamnosyltransferase
MDLSIIIVNWNSRDYLQKCIASILKWESDIEYEIVVIDSGSFDGAGEMLRRCYPQVRFIQSEANLGFAKANNAAFDVSRGRNILFLNPDTEVDGCAVGALCDWLDSLPNAAVVGAKLLNSDRSIQTTCIRTFPTIMNQLLDTSLLRNSFPRAGMWGAAALFAKGDAPSEVDAVSGACLMIKRLVFEKIGLFSTDYFMYSEDIDLCFKVHKAGWKIYYVPMAVIVHHGGASSSRAGLSVFSSVMMLESRWRFFRKTRSQGYCLLYRLAICCGSIIHIGSVSFAWPFYGLRGRGALIKDILRKWRANLRWALGGESWVKNY